MLLDNGNDRPIFLQLAEAIETNILKGIYPEETQIPSTTEIAITLKVNPATANRGVNMLVDAGIIYKKRGVGMFVKQGARDLILEQRKRSFYQEFLMPLLDEAKNIGLSREDVLRMIKNTIETASAERSHPNERH
jgi:DNA-binding transcriptional regulator YhcF (GntR family)